MRVAQVTYIFSLRENPLIILYFIAIVLKVEDFFLMLFCLWSNNKWQHDFQGVITIQECGVGLLDHDAAADILHAKHFIIVY